MPEPTYVLRRNDAGVTIARTLTDEDGDAISIAGATVRFRMAPIAGGATVVDEAATIVGDGTGGQVTYTFAAADSATAGRYLAEWQVTFSGGAIQTFPNGGYEDVLVTPDIPAAA
jgi:hypothetical protein